MGLEFFCAFPVTVTAAAIDRASVEDAIDRKTRKFKRQATYRWIRRGDEKLLRILVDPMTIEVVFHDERVEVLWSAPLWVGLIITQRMKDNARETIRQGLLEAGVLAV